MEVGRAARAVSYAKGCFLGQEPIVMARDRAGHVNRAFLGLKVLEGGPLPAGHEAVPRRAGSRRRDIELSLAAARGAGGARLPEVEAPGAGHADGGRDARRPSVGGGGGAAAGDASRPRQRPESSPAPAAHAPPFAVSSFVKSNSGFGGSGRTADGSGCSGVRTGVAMLAAMRPGDVPADEFSAAEDDRAARRPGSSAAGRTSASSPGKSQRRPKISRGQQQEQNAESKPHRVNRHRRCTPDRFHHTPLQHRCGLPRPRRDNRPDPREHPHMKKYRVAVIGRTGKGNYGHGLDVVWLKCDHAEIVAVADENEAGRAEAAKKLGAKNAYADYRQMLEKEKPQIVSVADRWLDCHRDMVHRLCRTRREHLPRKAVAQTLQQADEMVAACEKHHVKCAIAHQTRYSPRVKVIKELIADGRIGDVLELRGHGKEDTRGGGQDLMVLGTHTFDLMRHLAGDAKWCFARIQQDGRKAVAGRRPRRAASRSARSSATTSPPTYGFGGLATGQLHHAQGEGRRRARGTGWKSAARRASSTSASASCRPRTCAKTRPGCSARAKKPWQEITSAGVGKPETLDAKAIDNGNILIVNDLIEAIEKDRPPLDSIDDGRASLEMILAVYESHRHERPGGTAAQEPQAPAGGVVISQSRVT